MSEENIVYRDNKKFDTTPITDPRFKDISGQIINGIKVLRYVGKVKYDSHSRSYYECKCHCGKIFLCQRGRIKTLKSCGCLNRSNKMNEILDKLDTSYPSHKRFKDLSGKNINGIQVLQYVGRRRCYGVYYECKCHCGNNYIVSGHSLMSGHSLSCGCTNKNYKRSMRYSADKKTTVIRQLYKKMCMIKTQYNATYDICPEWNCNDTGFYAFYNWAIDNNFDIGMQILRKDTTLPYSPNNCILVDAKISSKFKVDGRYIEIDGYKYPLTIWVDIVGISFNTITARLHHYGWSDRDAVLTPIRGTPGIDVIQYKIPPEYEILNGCGQ